MKWSIWYSNSRVDGSTRKDWVEAPDGDVQVVVEWREPCHPCPDGSSERKWAHVTDRVLYTGVDEYSINNWPVKYGKWMDWDEYQEIWLEASGGK